MDAVLNIDLDFFTTPPYFGSGFGEKDFRSFSNYQPKTTNWLSVEDFLKKLNLKQIVRGCSVLETKQLVFYWQKLIDEKYLIPGEFAYVNASAHCNTYCFVPKGYYDYLVPSRYNAFDANIYLFRNEWPSKFEWITPDDFSGEILAQHFVNQRMRSSPKGNIIKLDISKYFDVEMHYSRWRETDLSEYNWKYISIVMSPTICNTETHSQYLQQLMKNISDY